MHTIAQLNGLVLAGGKSRRMGSDKGLISVHGEPMREYMFTQLARVCPLVFTSCRREQQVPLSMNPIYDAQHTFGPLNGLMTAFHFDSRCAWLTAAVDMPYVNAGVLQSLIDQRDPFMLGTCFFNALSGWPEPLLTIWEPGAFPLLTEFITQGKSSPRSFLSTHAVKVVSSISANVFRSLNSPDDLMELTEVRNGRLALRNQGIPDR